MSTSSDEELSVNSEDAQSRSTFTVELQESGLYLKFSEWEHKNDMTPSEK